jgi:hypothetical protein
MEMLQMSFPLVPSHDGVSDFQSPEALESMLGSHFLDFLNILLYYSF